MALNVGELYASLHLDKSRFVAGLRSARGTASSWARTMGSTFAQAGKLIAKGILIGVGALVAFGVLSLKSAVEFNAAMTLIQTQAGASATEVADMSKSILGIAGAVGTGPEDLAKGLYHVESAGIRGATALDVLKTAALGAKVGQADLETVTNALVAEVRSGIAGVKDMSGAMGVLNGIVGNGNMRMQDLADAMGSGILSVAKTFGVSIQSVGAALATMTDQGIPATDAATKIKMAIVKLGAPTAKGEKLLKGIGIGALDLAKAMRGKDGLHGALVLLKTHMDRAGLSSTKQAKLMADAFGGGKTGPGIMLLVNSLDKMAGKEKAIGAAAGTFGAAVDTTMSEAKFKADRVKASFQAIEIQLGQALLPAAEAALGGLGDLLNSPDVKRGVDMVVSAIGQITQWFEHLTGVANIAGPAIGVVLLILGAAFVSFVAGIVVAAAPVILIVGAIGAAVFLLWKAWDTYGNQFMAGVQAVIAVIKPVFDAAVAKLGEFVTFLVNTFGPPISQLFDALANTVLPILGDAFKAIADLVVSSWPTISAIAQSVGSVVGTMVGIITTVLSNMAKIWGWAFGVVAAIIKAVSPVIRAVGSVLFWALGNAAKILLGIMKVVWGAIDTVWRTAATIAGAVVAAIQSAFGILSGFFDGLWKGIGSAFKAGLNLVIWAINQMISALDSISIHTPEIRVGPMTMPKFDWNGLGIPTIPYLAKGTPKFAGGWAVLGEKGPELAKLPNGAQVFPAGESRALLSGANAQSPLIGSLNVTVNPGNDVSIGAARRFGQDVADEVANIMREQNSRFTSRLRVARP